jgi:hypothetical protein
MKSVTCNQGACASGYFLLFAAAVTLPGSSLLQKFAQLQSFRFAAVAGYPGGGAISFGLRMVSFLFPFCPINFCG